ncbi:arabinan endo-1,5-alpha-L-arabinosidase [Williamsia limnetica]|uniref:Arabinan endo-1,5-alpha-L-arabinosidase n=1 Tax=Williamsia limnetica TaxID=882452 RepID=A0A318RGD3_WILLI|nr:arabinan endo-1,5-alpha-L-arabinosidase [Williamsia limnetica]
MHGYGASARVRARPILVPLLAALIVLVFAPAPTAGAESIVRPVAADPSVIRADDGKYYMYATADDWGDGQGAHNMTVFTSFDLVDWRYVGDVFPTAPSWHRPGNLAWAPHISSSAGVYSLYYSLYDATNPCVGLATSASPTGPWTDLGRPVFCAKDVGVDGTIDPYLWHDGTSKTMFVGNFKGIHAIPLNAEGTAPSGAPVATVADNRFEGPEVVFRDGYYYLFVSAGHCCNGADTAYRVLAGRSTSLTGPYLDRKGDDLNKGGGALLLAGSQAWAGPGHNTVVTDDARTDWIVYHAVPRADLKLPSGAQRREGMIDKIVWANGWPEIGDGSPNSTRPALPDTTLPVRVSLTTDSPVRLPETGGRVTAKLMLTAPTNASYSGQVWVNVAVPGTSTGATIFGPETVNLTAGQTIEKSVVYEITPDSAAGIYGIFAFAGPSVDAPVEMGTVSAWKTGQVPAPNPGGMSSSFDRQ